MIEDCNGIPICTIQSISLPGNSLTNWILIQSILAFHFRTICLFICIYSCFEIGNG